MLTRRQFIAGLGAFTASTILSMGCNKNGIVTQGQINNIKPTKYDCDQVIKNVMIIDGSGKKSFAGKVGIKDEIIVAVGDFEESTSTKSIDGQGLVLAPGFIDIHTHTEDYVYSGGDMKPFLAQGITLQIGGNCGRSPRDIKSFYMTMPDLTINYGILMGYKTLRQMVMGSSQNRKASSKEITKMQEKLGKALEAGAVGLSTGLEYWPQNYSTTEEMINLCQVVKDYGGFYATHIRSEYDKVIEGLQEAIEIGNKAGVPVEYSHIKAGYKRNWDKFPKILDMLEEANRTGLDITADVYAYSYSSTDLGKKPFRHSISEENLEMAVAHPLVFYASDTGIYKGGRANHPRAYGNFPRYIAKFVREKKILTLEKAIKKMTCDPAHRLKLRNRGLIKPGYKADLVLFDPLKVADLATREKTAVFSEGIRQVWVNGVLSYNEGETVRKDAGQTVAL